MTTIGLANPKFPHNVGAVIRAASCFGADRVLYSGDRLDSALVELDRLPREERMKGYAEVAWGKWDGRLTDAEPGAIPSASSCSRSPSRA